MMSRSADTMCVQAVSEVSMEAPLQGGRGGSAARSGYRSMNEDAVDSVADMAAMADAQGAEDVALAAVQEAEVRR
jgi:hypothetical protein